MKRTLLMAALMALAMGIVAGNLMAQDERPAGDRPAGDRPAGERPARGDRGDRGAGMRAGFGMMDPMAQKDQFDKAVDSLKLEGEAKDKVATIRKEFAPKLEEAAAAMRKEGATREERMAARQKLTALLKEYTDAVKAALPEEAKKKIEEAMLPPVPAPLLLSTIKENSETLKITEEQTTALKALAQEYKPTEDNRAAMRDKLQAIQNSDKSDEEKAKARQELMAEMQKTREAAATRDRECTAKVAKILNADQMKQALELARKKMPAPGQRPARGERPAGGERPARGGEGAPAPASTPDPDAPRPDGIR